MDEKDVHNNIDELAQAEKESVEQKLPEQQAVYKADSIKHRAERRGVHNLPDQTNPPMGFDPGKAYDSIFPFLKLPPLQPNTPEDVISFDTSDLGGYINPTHKKYPLNAIFFGDNLHVLRALPSNCIDLIYIDPPFFSGRNYNQIWGDDNEVRTFYDLWEDGLPSYLVWLNARLWEMRRVLKDTGSIYVHCDWHASHYIKCEMDKIFGYGGKDGKDAGFINEIIWSYRSGGNSKKTFARKHDIILMYSKKKGYYFETQYYKSWQKKKYNYNEKYPEHFDEEEQKWFHLAICRDVWEDIDIIGTDNKERIGYPTQKPEALLKRIITASCPENGIVADFFMGGGTACAVAQKLNRRFIGCDISRVAASVASNRLIRDAEELSGKVASTNIGKLVVGKQLELEITAQNVPDIRCYYLGIYPVEKFEYISQKEFEDFILACYGATRYTGESEITGIMDAATTLLIGSVKPNASVEEKRFREFVSNTFRLRFQKNMRMKLKVIAWRFPPIFQKYARTLETYFAKKNIAVEIELIPINSQLFRQRILEHYPDVSKNEFLLKFISQPSIMDISCKKINGLVYEFKAIGARSNNLDGYLINCQWDFDYREGRFAENKYSLNREQKNGKYIAVLKTEKEFEVAGKYLVACRVQDNLGGESVQIKEVEIT